MRDKKCEPELHEFLDDNGNITARYVNGPTTGNPSFDVQTESPERNFANLGAGFGLTLPGGWAGFAETDIVLGNDLYEKYEFTAGLRRAF